MSSSNEGLLVAESISDAMKDFLVAEVNEVSDGFGEAFFAAAAAADI